MHDEYDYSLAEIGGPTGPSIFPLSRHVILEPAYDPEVTEAGIYVPLDARQKYPQIGYCIATASDKIDLHDLCIINVESSDVARTYNKVFALHLKDWGTELCEPDCEPSVREAVESFRANPATGDKRIRLANLRGEHLAFLCSDVLAYEWATKDTPGFSLLYPENIRLWIDPEGKMFYFVHEDHILGVIE